MLNSFSTSDKEGVASVIRPTATLAAGRGTVGIEGSF